MSGVSDLDVVPSLDGEDAYILQQHEKWESNVKNMLNALDSFAREEERTADVDEDVLGSIEKLKQLNAALASKSKRQRAEDASQMMQKQNALETELTYAKQAISQRDEDLDRIRRKLEDTESLAQRREHEIMSLRGIVQQLQRSEANLRKDVERAEKRVTNAEKRAQDLHNQVVAVRLEKDSVTQRFLQLTRNLSAVAHGHSMLSGTSKNTMGEDDFASSISPVASPLRRTDASRSTRPSDVSAWNVGHVREWLRENNLSAYVSSFSQNSVDGDMLFDLSSADLRDTLGMKDDAERDAFLCLREALRAMSNE